MVDPRSDGFVNYEAGKLSGYAFGLGVDRLSQLRFGIEDMQLFVQNDVRFPEPISLGRGRHRSTARRFRQ